MKKLSSLIAALCIAFLATSQVRTPVKWNFSAKKINPTTYELHFIAQIDPGWHIYTMDQAGEIGVPTSFTIAKNPLGTIDGKITTGARAVTMKDPGTGDMVKFYVGKVDFKQKVKLKAPVKTNFNGAVEFMVCDDRQCLPPTSIPFSIDLQ